MTSRVIFWAAMAFAFVMALLPQAPQLPGSPSDKVQHILAFAVLAGLGSAGYRSTPLLTLLIGISLFGALVELLQAIPALHRHSDPVDWLTDTVAVAAVLTGIRLWRGKAKMSGHSLS
jgi:hypothetical protein